MANTYIFKASTNFTFKNFSENNEKNSLISLNLALSSNGYHFEIKDNYKFNKAVIIYNLFTKDLKDNILNSRNKINVGKNSELHIIDFIVNVLIF